MARALRTAPTPATKMPLTVRFLLFKQTPGTVRYMEVDERGNRRATDDAGAVISTIYFRKAALRKWIGDEPPKEITLTITAE